MEKSKVASFREQHQDILQMVADISSYFKNDKLVGKISELSRLLSKFEYSLKSHLSMEDKGLYLMMLKSDDANVSSIAKIFVDDIGDLAEVFSKYMDNWNSDFKIKENIEQFIVESKSFFEKLKYRIDREEKTLFAVFDRVEQSTVKQVRFKWLFSGVILGLLFLGIGLFILLLGKDNSNRVVFDFKFFLWLLSSLPIIFGLVFFKIGINVEKQAKEKKELLKKNADMSAAWLQQIEMLNRELTIATGQIQKHANQLEKISNNISTPICLIDENFKIEQGFNLAFSSVFGKRDFFNKHILDVLFYSLSLDVKKELLEFLELAFSNNLASDEMINAANPVLEWIYNYNETGTTIKKDIKTKVVRVLAGDGRVEKLMFIFEDITFENKLQEEMSREKSDFESELELITVMFKNDKDIFVPFINGFNKRLKVVKGLIDSLKKDGKDSEPVNLLIRHMHTIKGETFSLGFEKIAEVSKDFESLLKEILTKGLSVDANLLLNSYLTKLNILAEELNQISKKLFNYSETTSQLSHNRIQVSAEHFGLFKKHLNNILIDFNEGHLDGGDLLELQDNMSRLDWQELIVLQKQLKIINEKTALEQNKKVELNFIYGANYFPADKYASIKEILMHLIRNSIAHGIELPEKRLQNKKSDTGKINIHLYREENDYVLIYSDDGSGLDIDKIKVKALEDKIVMKDELAKMDNDKISMLIFEDGLSTSKQIDDISGVGVGMSIVKNNVYNFLRGELFLTNNVGNGILLKIVFPV